MNLTIVSCDFTWSGHIVIHTACLDLDADLLFGVNHKPSHPVVLAHSQAWNANWTFTVWLQLSNQSGDCEILNTGETNTPIVLRIGYSQDDSRFYFTYLG